MLAGGLTFGRGYFFQVRVRVYVCMCFEGNLRVSREKRSFWVSRYIGV